MSTDTALKQIGPVIGSLSGIAEEISKILKRMRGTERRVTRTAAFVKLKSKDYLKAKLQRFDAEMLGPIEKGIELAESKKVPDEIVGGVDLKILPRYISYRAALLKEKATLNRVVWALIAILAINFISNRLEVSSLAKQLRTKEFIAVPGVENFTTVNPQSVPDGYVASAVDDFLLKLGNTNPSNIDSQYVSLRNSMSPSLSVRFEMEAAAWIDRVKREGIVDTVSINEKEIRTNETGEYFITATSKRVMYAGGSQLTSFDEVIQMVLELKPPQEGKRWFLQIKELVRQRKEDFRARSEMAKQGEVGP